MPFTTIRYTRTYTNSYGDPIVDGRPSFQLTTTITDSGTQTIVPVLISCTINPSGQLVGPDGALGVALDALDDQTTEPAGAAYIVRGEPGQGTWLLVATYLDAPTADLAGKQPGTYTTPVYSGQGPRGLPAWAPLEPWSNTTPYVVGPPASIVTRNGGTYLCVIANTGIDPAGGDSNHWAQIAAPGASGSVTDIDGGNAGTNFTVSIDGGNA